MHFVFPADPLNARSIDEYFAPQRDAFNAAGFTTSVLPRGIPAGATVVYRGWMFDADEYRELIATIERANATPLTSLEQYLLTHHLPNWYPLLRDLTPETVVFPEDADLVAELRGLGWPAFFLKDYVKSLKTSTGSLIADAQSAPAVIADMRKYRGAIEGGICVRRVAHRQSVLQRRRRDERARRIACGRNRRRAGLRSRRMDGRGLREAMERVILSVVEGSGCDGARRSPPPTQVPRLRSG